MTSRRIAGRILGRPITYARTETIRRAGGETARIQSARYRAWRKTAAGYILAARARAGGGPLADTVLIEALVGPNGIAFEVIEALGRRPKGVTGDLDNYAKALLDALVDGGAIEDDRQVIALDISFTTDPIEEVNL